ncbi:stage II sporulation protein P [Jeotgalibacillus soli]|uniref:Stage II sporulation protein P n=1 Tax=Jeotgalibacillus soli TaxID=889306 RepID=A0A0C2R2G5_9BACL|nr:stage II sporulation protein P [Jeotgalibacillus soli]KIL44465.1 hypothetical protein KP78_34290 [Jeotgalibacillus soli]
MKRSKFIVIEPVWSKTLYSIIRTTLLLLSLLLTAIWMPQTINWMKEHAFLWPSEIPEWWKTAFLEMESSSIIYQDPSIASQMAMLWRDNISNPSTWLTMEGVFFSPSIVAYAQSGHQATFPAPSESVPPTEWFLTGEEEEALDPETELQEATAASNVLPNRVLVYFTHSRESFLPYLPETKDPNKAHNSKVNITQMGPFLKNELEKRGIGVVVDDTDVMAKLKEQGLDYWAAYDESRKIVQTVMGNIPEVRYFVDVHRDAVRRDVTTLKHDGEDYAKVAFVVGGEHAQYEQNQALANRIHQMLNEKIPNLSRGVFIKKGAGTNGKYNQDLTSKSLLIELGGVDNTFEELQRTAEIFADILAAIVLEAEAVSQP